MCSFPQEIFNHVLNDLEIFMEKVNASSLQVDKRKKKKALAKKKSIQNGNILLSSLSFHNLL